MARSRTQQRAERRQARTKAKGHARRHGYGEGPMFKEPEVKPGRMFEDEYKEFRKSRGRRGWSPNPNKRRDENPVIIASSNWHSYHTTLRRVPIQELMETPIRKG